jgi:hypothetical protein
MTPRRRLHPLATVPEQEVLGAQTQSAQSFAGVVIQAETHPANLTEFVVNNLQRLKAKSLNEPLLGRK